MREPENECAAANTASAGRQLPASARTGRLRWPAVGLGVAGLLSLTACSGASDGAAQQPAGSPATSTAASVSSPAAGDSAGESPMPSVSVPAGPVKVIAQQKGLPIPKTSFTSGGKVTVGVQSLRRDPNGKTMTLRMVFTPDTPVGTGDGVTHLRDFAPGMVLPELLDRVNLKKYTVLRGEGGTGGYMATNQDAGSESGQTFGAWFTYAAPQDPVATLEVSVVDRWAPFPDIPVQR